MPSTNYQVFYNVQGNGVAVTPSTVNKTVNGFTVNISAGLAMTLGWLAIEDR